MPAPLIKNMLAAIMLLATSPVIAQKFTLSGSIAGMPETRVYLGYNNIAGKYQRDSLVSKDGKISFTGDTKEPVLAYLMFYEGSSKTPKERVQVFIEPGNIIAQGSFDDLKHLKFNGSATQTEYEALLKQTTAYNDDKRPMQERYNTLNHEYAVLKKANEDDPKLKALGSTLDSMREVISSGYYRIVRAYMDTHSKNYVSAYYLSLYKSTWPINEVKSRLAQFPVEMQQGVFLKTVTDYLNEHDDTTAGHPAKDFTAMDVNGKKISLADFKGKYVVLDFWASWCVPCRASTPHLVELYNKYHKSGLEVIAIADDDGHLDDWKKAIAKDNVAMWTHILRGYDSKKTNPDDLDTKYAIHSIPTKFLVDKNGVIVGRYDSEDTSAMDKKLAEVFAN